MAKIRDILVHVDVEIAVHKRKCSRNKNHVITLGTACLVVKGGNFNSSKNYCLDCANEILKQLDAKILDIKLKLG